MFSLTNQACLIDSTPFLPHANTVKRIRRSGGKPPSLRCGVIDMCVPVRTSKVEEKTSIEEVRALRLVTAIKTPYLSDGRFDLDAYDALVHHQVTAGADAVIVGGTTGEGQLMSWDEHVMLIAHTVNCFGSSIKVIGNTGSNSTTEAVHATEQGFAVGMHAALQINPYYGKTSLSGLVAHFSAVVAMGPTILYNVPSRTGQDIPPDVVVEVAKIGGLAGVKECAGNARVKDYACIGVTVWTGNDDECAEARWLWGAAGVVSVVSNLVPGLVRRLMYVDYLDPPGFGRLLRWLYEEPNPIGVNTALAQLGIVRPVFRLPYVPVSRQKRVEFVDIVREIGREAFVGNSDVRVLEDSDFVLLHRY